MKCSTASYHSYLKQHTYLSFIQLWAQQLDDDSVNESSHRPQSSSHVYAQHNQAHDDRAQDDSLEQSLVLLAGQDPMLQQVLIVAIPPGPQAELVTMHGPRVGVDPGWAHALFAVPAVVYFGNDLARQLTQIWVPFKSADCSMSSQETGVGGMKGGGGGGLQACCACFDIMVPFQEPALGLLCMS